MTDKQAAARLRAWDDILILSHRRPDGDAVGSAAGLCAALRQAGKRAYVLPNPDVGDGLLSYSVPYHAPEDFSGARVVSVDTAARNILQTNAQEAAVDLAIDHHASHTSYAAETCLDASCAACGELILRIARELTPLTREIALPLYLAVATDTGCFRYSNTTPASHRAAAVLMETGIDYASVNRKNFSIKSLRRIRLEMLLAESMEFHEGDTVVTFLTQDQLRRLGAGPDDTDDIASFSRQIEDSRIGITILELADGLCKVSVRSSPEALNAAALCARLGGGGHPAAAGCTLPGSVEEVRRIMLETLAQVRGK